jgi:hypothetical protein
MVMMAAILFKEGLVLTHFMVELEMMSFQESKELIILTVGLEEISIDDFDPSEGDYALSNCEVIENEERPLQ